MTDSNQEIQSTDEMTTFIVEKQKYGYGIQQAFNSYIRKHPPSEDNNRGDMDVIEYINTVLIPQFQKEWARCDAERKRDWLQCEECGELLPPHHFPTFSLPVKNICHHCRQYGPRRFGQPRRRK